MHATRASKNALSSGVLIPTYQKSKNQVYAGNGEVDEDTVAYIDENARISSYNLRSQYFSRVVNGKKIPAFIGDITLSVSGSQPMQGLASMLLGFGEYAGVGIKTSMGMGGMREKRENA